MTLFKSREFYSYRFSKDFLIGSAVIEGKLAGAFLDRINKCIKTRDKQDQFVFDALYASRTR
jgi:hypothetical protein